MSSNASHNVQQALSDLIALIQTLRAPSGCPWDRRQTLPDVGKYLLDEAYELFDALCDQDVPHIREELGDLLFLLVFASEIAAQAGQFTLSDAISSVREKMIRRHPHVFGDLTVQSVQDVKDNWQDIKKQERAGQTDYDRLVSNIPRSLPALARAQKITAAAARCGFDWPDANGVMEKLKEELDELARAGQSGNPQKIQEEMGDVLFTLVNLSRFYAVDAEQALSGSVHKFLRRFAYISKELSARGQSLDGASLREMDALWDEAKQKGI